MMMMTRTMRKFLQIFLILDGLLALAYLAQGEMVGLLNTQIGALSALLVALGSFMGYRHTIQNEVERVAGMNLDDDRDEVSKIDDPYDLYDEEVINEAPVSDEEAKRIFQEEKEKLKRRSTIKNIFLTYRGIFSPFRILGYFLLVFGFFYLEGNGYLQLIPYLLGLSILAATTVIASFTTSR